ncbi:hypothetical protein JZ751_015276 [Albula glossodonta]|uniref:Polymerase delta-interacting protein 3 n=1 Tax=Albula glossodonta TaxID=121402 RepID=A0A8T2P082_9TELE|nr:hypothetical protein JZ751_015276 [Albula glossodonta]
MADLSLDELIRRRGLNTRGANNRPGFRRGGGAMGRTFDARQKIGAIDVRQRLGGGNGGGAAFQIKDAREKLGQKDARFRIRGGGAGGGVQDARQMINSRKQQQGQKVLLGTVQSQTHSPSQVHFQTHVQQTRMNSSSAAANISFSNANSIQFSSHLQGLNSRGGVGLQQGVGSQKVVDARDRLSLKRSITATPTLGSATPIKITKTIQQKPVGMTSGVRINVPSRNAQSLSGEDDAIPCKQMKITTANTFLHSQSGAIGSPFSLSGPITKVVQNDSYTAPPPPTPPAAPRANPNPPAHRSTPVALQPVSRTVAGSQTTHAGASGEPSSQLAAPQRARLLKVGVAEVVFVRKEDAVSAYRKYNNRCLDGQPMKCNLHIQGNVITSDQPILLRLSDTPGGGGGGGRKDGLPPSLSRPGGRPASSQPTPEVDPQTILKALFKSSPQTPSTTDSPNSQATAFRIKI